MEMAVPLGEATQSHGIGHLKWEHFLISQISLEKAIQKGKERKKGQKKKEVKGSGSENILSEEQKPSSPLSRPTPGEQGASGTLKRSSGVKASGAGPSSQPQVDKAC